MAFIKNQIIKRLEKFIKNLSSDMLSISLLKGEAKLSDVKIDEIALMDMLKLPRFITLNSAICNEVFIKIPWTKLKSDPIYLAFDCVEVKISLDQGSDTSKNIVDSLMESANNMQNMNIDPSNPMSSGSGGLIDKIIEGVKISINTLLVTVISYNFKAIIEITSVIIQSTSPSWKPAGLKFSRISMKELGTYIHFKGNVTNNLTPLTRVILIMEDLLWVINESQISELIIFLSTCLLVSNDFQSRLTVKPYNPGALIAYNAAPFVVKTSEKYALFQRYQILEESMHVCIGKIDFHLCQNITNIPPPSDPPNLYTGNPKSLQVIVEKVGLDVYPRHYTLNNNDRNESMQLKIKNMLGKNNCIQLQKSNGKCKVWNNFQFIYDETKSKLDFVRCSLCHCCIYSYSAATTDMSRDNWLDYNQGSSQGSPIPPKPYRWALNSLTSYWHDSEVLLRNNTTPAFGQGELGKGPKGKPIPPPSMLHRGNGDTDSRSFISTLVNRAKSHLLQKCAVIRIFGDLRILDLSLYESNTDHGLIFELERARFNLPSGQPLIHLESNEYFYYNKLDFAHFLPVPNPSLFLEANPLKVVAQYDSLAWITVLASRVSTLWKMYYTDQCLPKIPRFHTDVHIESLMPRMLFPKYYLAPSTKIKSAELNRCFALQCQASQITISNFTLIGDPPPQSPTPSRGQFDPGAPLKECLKEIMDIKEVLRLDQNKDSFPETKGAPQHLNPNLFETLYPPATADFYDVVADRRHFIGPPSKGEELSAPPQFSTVTSRLPQTNINSRSCPGVCSYLCHDDPSQNNHAISPKCLWNLAWADRWVCRLSYLVVEREETEKARHRSNALETPLFGPLSCWLWLSPGPDPDQASCSEKSLNGDLQPFKHVKGFEDITLHGQSYGQDQDLSKKSSLQSGQHHKFYYQAVIKIASPDANPSGRLRSGTAARQRVDEGEILVVRLDNSKYGSLLLLTESLSLMAERITELESKVSPLLNHPSTVSGIDGNQPNGSGSSYNDPHPSNSISGQIISVKMSFLIKMVVFKFYDNSTTTSTMPIADNVDTPLSPPKLVNETKLRKSMSLGESTSTTTKDDLGSDKLSDVISDTSDYLIDEQLLLDSKMKEKAFSLKSISSRPLTPDRISLSSLGSIRPQSKGLPCAEPRKSFVGDTIVSSLVEIGARTRSVNARSTLIFPFLFPHTTHRGPEDVLAGKKDEMVDIFTKNQKLLSQPSLKRDEVEPEISQVEVGLDLLETPISTNHDLSHLRVSVIQEPTPFLTFALSSCHVDIDICQVTHDICTNLSRPCETPNSQDKVEVAFKLWARRGVIRDGAIVKMLNQHNAASNEDTIDEFNVEKNDEDCFLKLRASYSSKLDPHQQQRYTWSAPIGPDQIAADLGTVIQVSLLPANLDSGDRLQLAKLVPRAFQNFHRQGNPSIIIPLSGDSMELFSQLFTFSASQINTIPSANHPPQTNSSSSLKPMSAFTIFAHISQPIAITLLSRPTHIKDVHPDNFDLLLRPLIAYRLARDGVLVLTNLGDIIGEFFESYFDEMSAKASTNRSLTELRENSTASREIDRLRRENIALNQRIQELQSNLNPN